jgi:hypothetical protein
MLKIHETTTAEGGLSPVFLRVDDGGALALVCEEGTLTLPGAALHSVMTRYGQPLDTAARLVEVGSLDLSGGRVLRHARHLARFDVIARDYLTYSVPGQDALCALATTVAGALAHLGRAMATEPSERR